MRTNRLVLERFSLVGDDLDRRGFLNIVSRFNLFLWFYLISFSPVKSRESQTLLFFCCCYTHAPAKQRRRKKKWGRRKKIYERRKCNALWMIFPLIFGRVACHTKRMLLKTTAHLLSFFIRASQLHTAEHTHTRTYTHSPAVYTVYLELDLYQKIKLVFFFCSLFYLLITFHLNFDFTAIAWYCLCRAF